MKSALGSFSGAGYSLIEEKDSQKSMQELEEAYRTLDDEYLRQKYDHKIFNTNGHPDDLLGAGRSSEELEPSPVERKHYPKPRKIASSVNDQEVRQRLEDIVSNLDHVNGSVLRSLREAVGAAPVELQSYLKISDYYVKALEEDDFARLPPLVYIRGFLKSLLEYLGVPEIPKIIEGYSRNYQDWMKKQDKKKLL